MSKNERKKRIVSVGLFVLIRCWATRNQIKKQTHTPRVRYKERETRALTYLLNNLYFCLKTLLFFASFFIFLVFCSSCCTIRFCPSSIFVFALSYLCLYLFNNSDDCMSQVRQRQREREKGSVRKRDKTNENDLGRFLLPK